jgi:DNA replication protein DnaC
VKANLKQLRLPAMHAEFEKLAREAAAANESHEQYLLRLTELEVAARSANVLKARIKQAAFKLHKDFDTFDFAATPNLNKHKILELSRGE